ncbi:hypothetical protein [uncultured Draconibacterium sp.]|uniref:hypothetical protein n=1 Tax=uncultured Draconibacterium sp. TaxID=1573823 RepID=UPI003216927F
MKKKVSKHASSELDKFDRKQSKHVAPKGKSSKGKLSIYDEFDEDDDDFIDYSSDLSDEEE